MHKFQGIAFALLISSLFFTAQASDSELATGIGFDHLNNNFSNWQHAYVRGSTQLHPEFRIRAEARRYERFGFSNTELSSGGTWQFARRTSLDLEAAITPSANFRPEQRLTAQLYHQIWQRGGATFGAQRSNWPDNNSQELFIEPDVYYGPFRFAWRASWIDLQNVGSSSGHRLSAAWYYTDRSRITLALSDGREIEPIRDAVVVSSVRSVALFGRHHLRNRWSLEYALSYTQQGDFYNRTGVEVGVHYRF